MLLLYVPILSQHMWHMTNPQRKLHRIRNMIFYTPSPIQIHSFEKRRGRKEENNNDKKLRKLRLGGRGERSTVTVLSLNWS